MFLDELTEFRRDAIKALRKPLEGGPNDPESSTYLTTRQVRIGCAAWAHTCPVHGLPSFGFRCCYADLKIRASRGEELTPEELDFVGMKPNGHKPSGGWHFPGGIMHQFEVDDTLSDEDSAMLSALMDVPRQDQLEFVNAD